MYDVSGSDTDREWVEVYNSGSAAVDLSLWKLFEGNSNHSLNNISGGGVIPAGGSAVIADNTAKFLTDWPSFTGTLFDSVFSLSNTGETLSLKDEGLNVVDSYTYDPAIGGAGDGNSLQKIVATWIAASPTPGFTNSTVSITTSTSTTVATETITTTSSSTETVLTSPHTQSTSAHYSSSGLSNKKSTLNISLSAGRDRLATAGSPLEFRIETDQEYKRNTIFKWNFGDGSEGFGEVVTHTYDYPGEYVVVLNAAFLGGQAVSRIKVKVVDPEIVVVTADSERIEIKNNSINEVNLYGRVLLNGGRRFAFPQDTIIEKSQGISFSSKITGLKPKNAHEVTIIVVGEAKQEYQVAAEIEREKMEMIHQIENQLSSLNEQLVIRTRGVESEASVVATRINEPKDTLTEEFPASQTALILNATLEEETGGIRRWFENMKKFFLRNP